MSGTAQAATMASSSASGTDRKSQRQPRASSAEDSVIADETGRENFTRLENC